MATIPGMFNGMGLPDALQGLPEEVKRQLMATMQQRGQQPRPQQPPQGAMPQQPPQRPGMGPGMFAGMMPPPGTPGAPPPGAAPRMAGPQAQTQEVPGAATPEQAAADRAAMLRKAGAAVGQPQTQQTGMFTPIGSRSAAGNIFSGDKRWFSGIFDETEHTGPFDSFYVNQASSNSRL